LARRPYFITERCLYRIISLLIMSLMTGASAGHWPG
jgi:hypothetical protein